MSFPEPRLVRAELVAATELTPRVRGLCLQTLGPDPLEWLPGQYVEVGATGADKRMPFSVASTPDSNRPGYFELAVARGSGGGALDQLAVGEVLEVFGPKGRFVRRENDARPHVFVGTGTGLAPLRAMLQALLTEGLAAPVLVLFGARNEPEILWRSELESIATREPLLRYEPTLSQAQNGWAGRQGRVQDHLAELVSALPEACVYVCGVGEMVSDCVTRLTDELGFPKDRVVTEGH